MTAARWTCRRTAPSPGSSSATPCRARCRKPCWKALPGMPRAGATRPSPTCGPIQCAWPAPSARVDLGVAMQLSNIARDVGEDARNGRLYLPLEWMTEAGIDPEAFLANPVFSKELGYVVHRLLYAAEGYYSHASAGIARLPVKCRFGIGAASLLYREIGKEVARRGMNSVASRAVVSGRRKLWVLASGLGNMAIPTRSLRPTP